MEESGPENGNDVSAKKEESEPMEETLKTEETKEVEVDTTDPAPMGEKAETTEPEVKSEWSDDDRYKSLISQLVEPSVAAAFTALFAAGPLTPEDVDDRVVEMLKGFKADQGVFIAKQLEKTSLLGVHNRASFLMAVMKNFRDRVRTMGLEPALELPLCSGPDAAVLQAILTRTEYPLEVTMGQRKYGGPPPGGPENMPTKPGHECYIGHIPKELFEDSLIPLFEECGKIWDLRLMMDPMTGTNRGYGFVTFVEPGIAKAAAAKLNGHEIKAGRRLKVNVSVANTRLFLGNIPKSKTKEEILEELKNHAEGVREVIIYNNPDAGDGRRNRGFCFADFEDHKSASDAKRRFSSGKVRPFNCDLVVDWAEAQDEPDDEIMSRVKVLYVRNLKDAVTEDELRDLFVEFGEVERVKKLNSYAFIHFAERENAVTAMDAINGKVLHGVAIEITLAKPQMDKSKRERMKQERERRQMFQFQNRGSGPPSRGGPSFRSRPVPLRGVGGMRGRGRGGGGFPPFGGGGYGEPPARGRLVGTLGSINRQMMMQQGYGYEDFGYGGGYEEYGYGGDYGGASYSDDWGGYNSWGGDWADPHAGYADYSAYGAYGQGGGWGGGGGLGGGGGGGFRGRGRGRGRGGTPFGGGMKRKPDEGAGPDAGGYPKRPNPGPAPSGGDGGQPDWSADVEPGF